MATYGNVGEFRESVESWTQYAERLDQYFEANEIKNGKKKRAILLSVCGSKTYGLIRDLLQPKKPGEAEIKEIYEALEHHFSPKPSVIVERFKFHSKSRQEGENMAEFVAGLRRLSEHCQFGKTLEDMLRDRLVCGINDDRIQRRLLAERELSFEKAVEIALAHEMASKNLMKKTKGSIAEQGLKSATPEPDMAAPNPISAGPKSDGNSTPKPAEAEPVRPARNRRLPVRFKDYELKH